MKRILIIEDDPIVSRAYRSRLEKEGYTVEICADGQSGYCRVHEFKPDGLLLDLMLPKLNGIDLLKKVRRAREFEKLPVLVLTNAYVTNMVNEALCAGASTVYNKSSTTPCQIIDALAQFTAPPAVNNSPLTSKAGALVNYMKSADDTEFQKNLLKTFEESSHAAINEIRKVLQETTKADSTQRPARVEQLYRKVRAFSSNAGMAGLSSLGKISSAVEALVKHLLEKPQDVTPSTLRTTAQALDLFSGLMRPGLPADLLDKPPIEILVVDDEALSQRAIVFALEKAFLKPTAVEDAQSAIAKAKTSRFDLIFLDVNLPGMDGFALSEALRQEGPNKTTPFIFVTGTTDFKTRTQSALCGGADFIAKPFVFIELTVKALTCVLRRRLESVNENPIASTAASTGVPAEKAELII
jgi:DNA-binding response OmpR family regulator